MAPAGVYPAIDTAKSNPMFRLLRSKPVLALAGYALYRWWQRRESQPPAYAAGEGGPAGTIAPVRNAGPDSMRDGARRQWDGVDQHGDESFPASDPPGRY